jgi:hypothetical protein
MNSAPATTQRPPARWFHCEIIEFGRQLGWADCEVDLVANSNFFNICNREIESGCLMPHAGRKIGETLRVRCARTSGFPAQIEPAAHKSIVMTMEAG